MKSSWPIMSQLDQYRGECARIVDFCERELKLSPREAAIVLGIGAGTCAGLALSREHWGDLVTVMKDAYERARGT